MGATRCTSPRSFRSGVHLLLWCFRYVSSSQKFRENEIDDAYDGENDGVCTTHDDGTTLEDVHEKIALISENRKRKA